MVRRTAEIALIDPKDTECTEAKSNLTPEKYHRFMSNNSLYIEETPTKEYLQKIFDSIRATGEPGFVNVAESKRRRGDYAGTNPCFCYDTPLLTSDGYIPIGDLEGRDDVEIVSYDGQVSVGKVWKSGEKNCVKLIFSDNTFIECTHNHVFMTINGDEVMAKNLLFKRVMPYLYNANNYNTEMVKLGYSQGDGVLSDLNKNGGKGVTVIFGEKDDDVAKLFEVERDTLNRGHYYTKELSESLASLEFSNKTLPYRTLPKTIWEWSDRDKLSFLRGLYTANGSVVSIKDQGCRIALKTTCKDLAIEVVSLLAEFDIHSYITVNKPRLVKFDNGEYLCRESYDVNIQRYQSKLDFYNKIGFVQSYKEEKLKENLISYSPKIKGIRDVGVKSVYDFTEPINHWGVVNGYIAHNCGEILLPANAVCNLTTINLTQFVVKGKYEGQAAVDWTGLKKAMRLSARAGYRMTCVDLELPGWNEIHHRDRLLGCSITGYQDLIGMLPEGFNEELFLDEMKKWTRFYADEYAEELGTPKSKLVTSVKPEGTLSLIAGGVSPGVHYQHSPYFIRRIRVNASDPLAKTALELGWQIHPEVGQTMENATTLVIDFPCKTEARKTKNDVSAVDQLKTYLMFQKNYVEHNASNTISVKPDEWEEVVDFVHTNWNDVLGVTFLESNSTYYPLMPYEECTKEVYDDLLKRTRQFDPEILNNMEITTRNMGKEYEILDDKEGCENGVCPIR